MSPSPKANRTANREVQEQLLALGLDVQPDAAPKKRDCVRCECVWALLRHAFWHMRAASVLPKPTQPPEMRAVLLSNAR